MFATKTAHVFDFATECAARGIALPRPPAFRLGDRVVVCRPDSKWHGHVGIVTAIRDEHAMAVVPLDGILCAFRPDELHPAPASTPDPEPAA